jgi:hypothetical protein
MDAPRELVARGPRYSDPVHPGADVAPVIPDLKAKTIDGASAFSYRPIFLPFISSEFVPRNSMPGPVRAFVRSMPLFGAELAQPLLSESPTAPATRVGV